MSKSGLYKSIIMVRGFLYCYINKGKNRLITKEYSQRVGESPGQYGLTAFGRCCRTCFDRDWLEAFEVRRSAGVLALSHTAFGRCSVLHLSMGMSFFENVSVGRDWEPRPIGECFDGTALFDTADGLVNEFTSKNFLRRSFNYEKTQQNSDARACNSSDAWLRIRDRSFRGRSSYRRYHERHVPLHVRVRRMDAKGVQFGDR